LIVPTIKFVQAGSNKDATLLILKKPDQEVAYSRLMWRAGSSLFQRQKKMAVGLRRFWSIGTKRALGMLLEARSNNFLSQALSRWRVADIKVLDSAYLKSNKRRKLIAETLNRGPEDMEWRKARDLRIVACCEPAPSCWRKVMIFSPEACRATFRAQCPNNDSQMECRFISENFWLIHPVIMDGDVSVFNFHLSVLENSIV